MRAHNNVDKFYHSGEEIIYLPGRMKLDPLTGKPVHEDTLRMKVVHPKTKAERLFRTKMISLEEAMSTSGRTTKTVTKKDKKSNKVTCNAVTLSGKPCGFKATKGCFCGRHSKTTF
jgi:hypothetical protein